VPVKALRAALAVIRENRRAYVVLNVLYYGTVVVAMIGAAAVPHVQQELGRSVGLGFTQGPLSLVADAYVEGRVASAAMLTFLVNLIGGAFLVITLPSMFIPFAGVALGLLRAALWGLVFSPAWPELRSVLPWHSVTLLLEGQAYVLAMFGSYTIWATTFRGGVQAGGLGRRYVIGLARNLYIYLLVVPVLAVAAIYEALAVILLLRGPGP